MRSARPQLCSVLCILAALLGACHDSPSSPPARPEPPREQNAPDGAVLGPIDLVYVCGNKFLATNSTRSEVQVTYRVAGTDETGSLTLREGINEDEGFSETELETAERGIVELYQDDQRVAQRRNRRLPCGPSPMSASIAGFVTAESGEWSPPFFWPSVAVHLSLLPTGGVLSWGNYPTAQLWDPSTGSFTALPTPVRLFCAGHSLLSDGRLLISGGHISNGHGLPNNTLFTAGTESWGSSTPMQKGRWYPSNTTLANGDVLILAGTDETGAVVGEPEVWSPSGSVRALSSASRNLPYYPRMFLGPDGRVFYAGQDVTTRYLDPTGTGSWTTVGNRLYGVREYGAAVMYDEGKILYVGGGLTTNTAEIIDLNSGAPAWQWTGSMVYPRRHLNATVLPTGEVLATGGTGGTTFNDLANAVHAAELWNPTTGTWTVLASNTVNRGYHATSILLPDGRVLHTGSGNGAGAPSELNAELFSPPYLFRGSRPTITAAPSSVAYGTSFSVETPEADAITNVSLIRLGSTTHAADMNQRFQWLSFTREAGALTITVPTSRNRTPPGHYMLFILDGNGVPSVARIVKVGSDGEPPPPPNAAPVANFTSSCNGVACNFTDTSTDDGSVTGWSWDFGDNGGSSSAQHPSYTYAAESSYEVNLTVTDNGGKTGTITQTVTLTPPSPNEIPAASFTSACTGLTCSFTDGSTDADGTIVAWSWGFGDGSTSNAQNPGRTYTAAGTYAITLTVTDNDGATNQSSATLTVTAPPPPTIALTVTGRTDATKQYMTLRWTGAAGATMDVYRNGPLFTNTANDGLYVNSRIFQGAASYTYKVCQVGTTICSNEATVTFAGVPVPFTLTVTGRTDATKQYMTLKWTGATGATVDVYRNGPLFTNTANDGLYVNSRIFQGAASYTYKVCQVGTTICSNEATVTFAGVPVPFTLTVTGRTDATKQYMTLKWTGATGATVDVYRNGPLFTNTANDGLYVNSRIFQGAASYTYKVCQVGTTICSNEATVTFAGVPVPFTLTVTGRTDATKQYMTLKWTGATGATVDVYRNGPLFTNTANDGLYVNSRIFQGAASYTYKLCQLGSSICSNTATVVF